MKFRQLFSSCSMRTDRQTGRMRLDKCYVTLCFAPCLNQLLIALHSKSRSVLKLCPHSVSRLKLTVNYEITSHRVKQSLAFVRESYYFKTHKQVLV